MIDATVREHWLAERRTGIGSSDAAAVVGLDPWRTPLQVYLEKRGEIVPPDLSDNDAVRFGALLEHVVADEYARRNDVRVRKVHRILRHPKHEWMICHLDRKIEGLDCCLEVKTANTFADGWGEPGSDEIPEHYVCQVQHQLAVTGYGSAAVAVLIGGQRYAQYWMARNDDLIADLVRLEQSFWERVQSGTPPAPRSVDDARLLYPRSVERTIEADDDTLERITRLAQLEHDLKLLEGKREELRTRVMGYMGDAEKLVSWGAELASWRTVVQNRLDQSALKQQHPKIYADLCRPIECRTFRLLKGAVSAMTAALAEDGQSSAVLFGS